MDVQFQAMMQQFGMTGQGPDMAGQPAPPPAQQGMPPAGPPSVNGAVLSSQAQGFPPAQPTEPPTQDVAPGSPRPGARTEINEEGI